MASTPYHLLITEKRWADRGLLEVVGNTIDRLSKEDSALMLLVLDHVHTVDKIFQYNVQGLTHTFRAPRSDSPPEFQSLAESMREIDDWYVSYVARLTERDLGQFFEFTFTSGKPARMRRSEMILHVCLHGNYHRGNAGALLQLRRLTPSRDAITDFLEVAR